MMIKSACMKIWNLGQQAEKMANNRFPNVSYVTFREQGGSRKGHPHKIPPVSRRCANFARALIVRKGTYLRLKRSNPAKIRQALLRERLSGRIIVTDFLAPYIRLRNVKQPRPKNAGHKSRAIHQLQPWWSHAFRTAPPRAHCILQ